MEMLHMISGKTLIKDGLSNKIICEMTSAEKIEGFLNEQKLQWFQHIEKMDDERAPVKSKSFVVNGSKRGRLKKKWKETIEKRDMLTRGLKRSDAQDCILCRGLAAKTGPHPLAGKTNLVPGR